MGGIDFFLKSVEKAHTSKGGLLVTTLGANQTRLLETLIEPAAAVRSGIPSVSQVKLNILIHIKDF